MWRESEPERVELPRFSFSRCPLSFLAGLETSVSTQTPVVRRREQRAWYAAGPAQESVEPLSLARPACLFALTSHSLRGYGTCLVKGAIVLQGKSVTNIYHGGNAKPWPAASQTRAVKFTTVHF